MWENRCSNRARRGVGRIQTLLERRKGTDGSFRICGVSRRTRVVSLPVRFAASARVRFHAVGYWSGAAQGRAVSKGITSFCICIRHRVFHCIHRVWGFGERRGDIHVAESEPAGAARRSFDLAFWPAPGGLAREDFGALGNHHRDSIRACRHCDQSAAGAAWTPVQSRAFLLAIAYFFPWSRDDALAEPRRALPQYGRGARRLEGVSFEAFGCFSI